MGGVFDMIFGRDNESQPQEAEPPASPAETGKITDVGSLEQQAAARRLARMSKYFTTPTGVLESPTGSSGVF